MKKWIGLIGISFFMAGCGQASENVSEIHIMAAASLTDALGELQVQYEEDHDVKLVINYGSSGKLREQITQGAPADIFLSASLSDMQTLEDDGEVSDSVHALVNRLVLIATPEVVGKVHEWNDLLNEDLKGIAMGQPESVPAGRYALESLENAGMWEEVKDRVIYGSDVRQVLTYVETGNTDVGLVYHTDALSSDEIEIIDFAPEQSHQPIIYPMGLLTNAEDNEAATEFYHYLQTEDTLAVFTSYGFEQGE